MGQEIVGFSVIFLTYRERSKKPKAPYFLSSQTEFKAEIGALCINLSTIIRNFRDDRW